MARTSQRVSKASLLGVACSLLFAPLFGAGSAHAKSRSASSPAVADSSDDLQEEHDRRNEIAPRLVVASQASAPGVRRHRGDWEPPDTVVFAYAGAWPATLRTMVRATSLESKVFVLVAESDRHEAAAWFKRSKFNPHRVRLVKTWIESPWVRDYGPLQVYDEHGQLELLDADYAPDRPGDDEVPFVLASTFDLPLETLPFGIDGGALISNGRGLCGMTLDSYYESGAPETPGPARDELMAKLGCRVIALVPALVGEPTGHIDMVAQFLGPDVLAVAQVEAKKWPDHHARLEQVVVGFEAAAEALGVPLKIERVPMPILSRHRFRSYLNGLHLTSSYLVPRYRDVPPYEEQAALRALATAMPRTKLKSIRADRMISLDGAVHCLSLGMTVLP